MQYGRRVNFNYLPPKIKFGAFRLKLAHKMQESPDPHILHWTYRLNCTVTIYAILMTYKRAFRITRLFFVNLELSVRGESNEFHIFNNFILQQIIVSKLTVHVHPRTL